MILLIWKKHSFYITSPPAYEEQYFFVVLEQPISKYDLSFVIVFEFYTQIGCAQYFKFPSTNLTFFILILCTWLSYTDLKLFCIFALTKNTFFNDLGRTTRSDILRVHHRSRTTSSVGCLHRKTIRLSFSLKDYLPLNSLPKRRF